MLEQSYLNRTLAGEVAAKNTLSGKGQVPSSLIQLFFPRPVQHCNNKINTYAKGNYICIPFYAFKTAICLNLIDTFIYYIA